MHRHVLRKLQSLRFSFSPLSLPPITPKPASYSIMTKESTPPPTEQTSTKPATHEPPSLPASPIAKRPKQTPSKEADMSTVQSNGSGASLPPLQVKKLVETATAPTRGSAFAAGYDMYAAKETVIPARGKALVDTGIAVAVPGGTCMFP